MVDHPVKYLCSSSACNALGEMNELVTSQLECRRLGATKEERKSANRQLFRARIPEMTLNALREATNKAWVLGGDWFKTRISKKLNRPAQSSGHDVVRKSKAYLGD